MVVAVKIPTEIVKRSGEIVPFDPNKITQALNKCFQAIGKDGASQEYTERVINILSVYADDDIPTVEKVQDTVVFILQSAREYTAAEHYIIYRYEHTKQRNEEKIPQNIIDLYKKDASYFPTPLQRFQYEDKYSRWRYDLGRRETWTETVDRTVNFLKFLWYKQIGEVNATGMFLEIEEAIRDMKVMPSMRLMAMAGPAAERDNAVIYNCAYLPIDGIDSFCELMSNAMAGCGVGFSVEFENTDKIPKVFKAIDPLIIHNHIIEDSAEGWVYALRLGIGAWITAQDVKFDYSFIRPKGTPLKTKGGRASGPEPLRKLLEFIRNRILAKQGKKLTTLDCHDIACAIGQSVVSGGVRRTALISIFDEDDKELIECKNGNIEDENPQRWYANNSAVWTNVDKMTAKDFLSRMWNTISSERGEPGIFSRETAIKTMPKRRLEVKDTGRNPRAIRYGSNPCGEIVLRPFQFCNLTDVVARPDDTIESLDKKVRLATIIGTIQSTATYFPNLRSIWKLNCEEERLLGVGINGQLDCPLLSVGNSTIFSELQKVAIVTNKKYAKILGINESTSITCVKPNGNSSVLLNTASGLHARWAPYYIRRVRVSAGSPLARVLQDSGMVLKPENGEDVTNPYTLVASFPVRSPYESVVASEWPVLEQLQQWILNKRYWTEHNPSVTITYKPTEVLDMLFWLWRNKTMLGGITILPYDEQKYDQMPYETITESEYSKMVSEMPPRIQWERIYLYEKQDTTNAASLVACDGPVCMVE